MSGRFFKYQDSLPSKNILPDINDLCPKPLLMLNFNLKLFHKLLRRGSFTTNARQTFRFFNLLHEKCARKNHKNENSIRFCKSRVPFPRKTSARTLIWMITKLLHQTDVAEIHWHLTVDKLKPVSYAQLQLHASIVSLSCGSAYIRTLIARKGMCSTPRPPLSRMTFVFITSQNWCVQSFSFLFTLKRLPLGVASVFLVSQAGPGRSNRLLRALLLCVCVYVWL